MIILDTNVISGLMQSEPSPELARWLDAQPRISIWTSTVTVMEIRYGLAIMPAGRRRTMRMAEFERLLQNDLEDRVLAFDHVAAEHAASLLAVRYRAGKPRDYRDTMIAGIALAQHATLATGNTRHFDDLTVPVVDPWRHAL
jgi:hypothetical protein